MKYKQFLKIMLTLQNMSRVVRELKKLDIDLVNFTKQYLSIISIMIESIYGKEGCEMWAWFCFENEFGNGGLEAFDKNENQICYSHETLWVYLENLKYNI